MFFITPQKEQLVKNVETEPDDRPSKRCRQLSSQQSKQLQPQSSDDVPSGYYPKRVPKACDRCRIKKVRCSGGQLCKRCGSDGVVCITTTNGDKEESPVQAQQYHLVESQRDRLLQIIAKIADGKNEDEFTKLRDVLSNMGLSMKNVSRSPETTENAAEPIVVDKAAFDEISNSVWTDLYNQLRDNEPLELWSELDEMPVTTACSSSSTNPPPAIGLPHLADAFDFNELVDWNSSQPYDQTADTNSLDQTLSFSQWL